MTLADPRYPGFYFNKPGFVPHPNGRPGVYLGAASSSALPVALGGRGNEDVASFTFDSQAGSCTLDANAAAFNTIAMESLMRWSPSGLYAVCGTSRGVFQARASVPGGPLGAPTLITGLPIHPQLDCTPARVGGQHVLFMISGNSWLAYVPHDVANSRLGVGAPVVLPPTAAFGLFSPAPIQDAGGETRAVMCAARDGRAQPIGLRWDGDLDPGTPMFVADAPAPPWIWSVSEAGGRLYVDLDSVGITEIDFVALLGDTTPAGQVATVTAIAPAVAAPLSFLFAARRFGSPISLPALGGSLGLDPGAFVAFLGAAGHGPDGRGVFRIPVPFGAAGMVPLQAITLLAGTAHFTSTAALDVR